MQPTSLRVSPRALTLAWECPGCKLIFRTPTRTSKQLRRRCQCGTYVFGPASGSGDFKCGTVFQQYDPREHVDVDIRPENLSTPDRPFWRCVITTSRGYCWRCTWAGDKPSEEQVRQAWAEDHGRKDFVPHRS